MILVTGSSGFIGHAIAERLENQDITGIDLLHSESPRYREIIGDITDRNFLGKLEPLSDLRAIVHTVALISSAYCQQNPYDAFRVNLTGTLNMLELARRYDVPKFVYISSGGIYGTTDPDAVIDEKRLPDPRGIYSTTKVCSELAVKEYCESYSLNAASLRITAPYSPRMNGSRYPFQIPDSLHRHTLIFAIKCALSQDIIMPVGGDHTVNYTYVGDIAEGVALSMKASFRGFEAFNIAGGKNYSISELGQAVKELCPKIKVSIGPGDLTKGYDENDPMLSKLHIRQGLFDTSKASRMLGFRPSYSLKSGMKELISYIRSQMPSKGQN